MSPEPAACLIVLNAQPGFCPEPQVGQTICLRHGANFLGRGIGNATVPLQHNTVGRRDARIKYWDQDGEWYLDDLNSRSGTWVNDARLSPGETGRVRLNDRDRIRLAVFEFWFRLVPPDAAVWLTSSVVALARCVSVDREFHLLPILADALEEAGCADEMILEHCRLPEPDLWVSWVAEYLCIRQAEAESAVRFDPSAEQDSPLRSRTWR